MKTSGVQQQWKIFKPLKTLMMIMMMMMIHKVSTETLLDRQAHYAVAVIPTQNALHSHFYF
jgi:hypothetical protein